MQGRETVTVSEYAPAARTKRHEWTADSASDRRTCKRADDGQASAATVDVIVVVSDRKCHCDLTRRDGTAAALCLWRRSLLDCSGRCLHAQAGGRSPVSHRRAVELTGRV